MTLGAPVGPCTGRPPNEAGAERLGGLPAGGGGYSPAGRSTSSGTRARAGVAAT